MMERIVENEWLDGASGSQREIDASLRSIGRVNRRFGGARLHTRLLRTALAHVSPQTRLPHILEVASGRADVLRHALMRLGTRAEVTLLDRKRAHLPQAEVWPAHMPVPRMLVGDALELPLPPKSADIVSCCLFLHHLEPPEVMRFLEQAQQVARVAVIVNDLERTSIHFRLAQLNRLFDPSRISRHDGPVSVRRSYTFRELHSMLVRTGRYFVLERAYLFRLGAILWCS